MRKLIYFIACTADGFIAREDGRFDFFPMTGDHLRHIAATYPETIPGHLRDQLGVHGDNKHFDTVLMGRNTYAVGTAIGVPNPYPHLRQYVISRTLTASPDPAVRLVSEDPVEIVRELKQEGGLDIWLCGGASLAGALYEEIDELILKVNPVIVGIGIPLFQQANGAKGLDLTAHKIFASGVAIHRYRVVK
jgi:dihydrofolate reductase